MEALETEDALTPSRPHTLTVLGLLSLAAMILSYLIAYAVMDALVSAEVVRAWPREQDPRPKLLLGSFVSLMVLFCLVALAAKFFSSLHLRRIDAMQEDEAS